MTGAGSWPEPRRPQVVDAVALDASYRPRRRAVVTDGSGEPVGDLALAPAVYVWDVAQRLRTAPALPTEAIHQAMRDAARVYARDEVAGLTPEAYVGMTCAASGLPHQVVAASLGEISGALRMMPEIIQASTPRGSVWSIDDPRAATGCGLCGRRADVLAVLAAGNGPGVHGLWPQAVAMGYRTLVRPSVREPFTAQRLVLSLHRAGLGDYVALVPTDHAGADALVAAADLALVYGGQDIVDKFRGDPRVLVQGPGRSKILVGRDADLDEAVRLAAHSVLALGGVACVSASAVLVEGDARAFAARLSTEFDTIASSGARPRLDLVDSHTDPLVQRELPLPCVTVAPYDRRTGHQALAGSLVVTVLSRDRALVDGVLRDSSISNVYVGAVPTTWMSPLVPHDGYLAEFLTGNRGVKVQQGWFGGAGSRSAPATSPQVLQEA